MQPPPPIAFPVMSQVNVGTLYAEDGPLVQIEISRRVIRLAPNEALSIGQKIAEAAASATLDGFLVQWLLGAGFEQEQIVALLAAFREYREHALASGNDGGGA